MIALMDRATPILTDSLVGCEIRATVVEPMRLLQAAREAMRQAPACYGEDPAAARIVDAVLRWSVA